MKGKVYEEEIFDIVANCRNFTSNIFSHNFAIVKVTEPPIVWFLKGRNLNLFFILVFILIAISTFLQDLLAMKIRNQPNEWKYSLIFMNEWFLWAALTPVMVYLGKKFPVTQEHPFKNILLHLVFAVSLVTIHFFLRGWVTWFLDSVTLKHGHTLIFYWGAYLYSVHVFFILYFFVVGTIQALNLLLKYQESRLHQMQLKSELVQSQLQSLKMQLQPHFLFNTHHAIVGLMLQKENERAINMLTQLSDLLRKTLDKNEDQFTDVKGEMEMLTLYLDIQQERFHNRLKIFLHIPSEVAGVRIPAFILQPLVENAIQHGIAKKADSGVIEIRAEKSNGQLAISIRDDGEGLNGMEREGIGLKNTKARLMQLYGDQFQLLLRNHSTKGTEAVLIIPFETQHPDTA